MSGFLGSFSEVFGGPGTGTGAGEPPAGFIYLMDEDGYRLTDNDGAYLMEPV